MNGISMMVATASALLSITMLSAGPQTRLAPPDSTVKTPPFTL